VPLSRKELGLPDVLPPTSSVPPTSSIPRVKVLVDQVGLVFQTAGDAARLEGQSAAGKAWASVLDQLPDKGTAAKMIARFSVEQADAGLAKAMNFLAEETGPIAKALAASGVSGVQEEAKNLLDQIETAYRTNTVGKPEKAASGMFDLARRVFSDPVSAAWSPGRKALVGTLRERAEKKMPDLRSWVDRLNTTSKVLLGIISACAYGAQTVSVKDGILRVTLPADLRSRLNAHLPGGFTVGLTQLVVTPEDLSKSAATVQAVRSLGSGTAYTRYQRAGGENTLVLGYRATQDAGRGRISETVEAAYNPLSPEKSTGRAQAVYTVPLARGGGQLSTGAGVTTSQQGTVANTTLNLDQALAKGRRGQNFSAGLYARASAGTRQAAAWEGGLQAKARFGANLRKRRLERRKARQEKRRMKTYEPRGNPGIVSALAGPLPDLTQVLKDRTTPEPIPTYISIVDRKGGNTAVVVGLVLLASLSGWLWYTLRTRQVLDRRTRHG
jgi:hypothetical protein